MEENVTETLICKLLVQAAVIVVRRLGSGHSGQLDNDEK